MSATIALLANLTVPGHGGGAIISDSASLIACDCTPTRHNRLYCVSLRLLPVAGSTPVVPDRSAAANRNSTNVDDSSELTTHQRLSYLEDHALFGLVVTAYPNTICDICEVIQGAHRVTQQQPLDCV
eukprot:5217980-Amphidinium_carterae.2